MRRQLSAGTRRGYWKFWPVEKPERSWTDMPESTRDLAV